MVIKTSFFPVFLVFLLGLGWMADQLKHPIILSTSRAQVDHSSVTHDQVEIRQAMLEMLDHLVTREREYKEKNGRFTFLLSRVLAPTLFKQQSDYEIRVIQADAEHLVIFAFSEQAGSLGDQVFAGSLGDQVFIDEEYRIRSNFIPPEPSLEYIRSVALGHLKSLKRASHMSDLIEPTQFKNYFRYTFTNDSSGQKIVRAFGVRAPVLGLELQWSGESSLGLLEAKTLSSSPVISDLLGPVAPALEHLGEIHRKLLESRVSERRISSLQDLQERPQAEKALIGSESLPLVIESIDPSQNKKR